MPRPCSSTLQQICCGNFVGFLAWRHWLLLQRGSLGPKNTRTQNSLHVHTCSSCMQKCGNGTCTAVPLRLWISSRHSSSARPVVWIACNILYNFAKACFAQARNSLRRSAFCAYKARWFCSGCLAALVPHPALGCWFTNGSFELDYILNHWSRWRCSGTVLAGLGKSHPSLCRWGFFVQRWGRHALLNSNCCCGWIRCAALPLCSSTSHQYLLVWRRPEASPTKIWQAWQRRVAE